jgi:hypothetical protein
MADASKGHSPKTAAETTLATARGGFTVVRQQQRAIGAAPPPHHTITWHIWLPQEETIPYEPTPRAEIPPATAIPVADLGPHGSHGGNGGLLGCGCSRVVEVEGRVRAWPRPSYGRPRLVRVPTTKSAAPAMTEHAQFARRKKGKMVPRLTKRAHAS